MLSRRRRCVSKGGSSNGIFACPASHDGYATFHGNSRLVDDPILPLARRVKVSLAVCSPWSRFRRAVRTSQARLYVRKLPQMAI